jgi:hypothetical protein
MLLTLASAIIPNLVVNDMIALAFFFLLLGPPGEYTGDRTSMTHST